MESCRKRLPSGAKWNCTHPKQAKVYVGLATSLATTMGHLSFGRKKKPRLLFGGTPFRFSIFFT